jgi:hypothetical protein
MIYKNVVFKTKSSAGTTQFKYRPCGTYYKVASFFRSRRINSTASKGSSLQDLGYKNFISILFS